MLTSRALTKGKSKTKKNTEAYILNESILKPQPYSSLLKLLPPHLFIYKRAPCGEKGKRETKNETK